MRCLVPISVLIFVSLTVRINAQPSLNSESRKQLTINDLSAMPISFTENHGQWDEKALFKAEAGGVTFWYCKDEVIYQFTRDTDELLKDDNYDDSNLIKGMPEKFNKPLFKKESMVLRTQFVGANPDAEIIGENCLPYKNNYFLGNTPAKWATDVPNYSAIIYKDIWPGIDLKYHGSSKGMKYDFIVNPVANISQIRIRYDGVDNLAITSKGDLQADTRFGLIYENIPLIYQDGKQENTGLTGRYVVVEPGIYGFEVDGFNVDLPLVIDPELVYSSYFGGVGLDYASDIVTDSEQHIYIAGMTSSTNLPILDSYDNSYNGGYDGFIAKFAPSSYQLEYMTYLGGGSRDIIFDIAIDLESNVYATGSSWSSDFPCINAYDSTKNGIPDAFISKISASGNSLIFSSFLGGSNGQQAFGIAVDSNHQAVITGFTESNDFPLVNPLDNIYSGNVDAFVAKFSSLGNSLIYSTYFGGSYENYAKGIAVDRNGNAYITGYTSAANFLIKNAYDSTYNGLIDAFISVIANRGDSLLYSSYFGGSGTDIGEKVFVDNDGYVFIIGSTESYDFPRSNAADSTYGGNTDGFVFKIQLNENNLIYSTYIGGSGEDNCRGIAYSSGGSVYISGYTDSPDFNLLRTNDPSYNGNRDGFALEIFPSGYPAAGTYIGGSNEDNARAISCNSDNSVLISGGTLSRDFPIYNAIDSSFNGDYDAFLIQFNWELHNPIIESIPPINGMEAFLVEFSILYSDPDGTIPILAAYNLPDNSTFLDNRDGTSTFSWIPETGQAGSYQVLFFADDGLFADTAVAIINIANLPICSLTMGDANGDSTFNALDISYIVNYFKGIGIPPSAYCSCPPLSQLWAGADINGNCQFNGIDVQYGVNSLKGIGPLPRFCPNCPGNQ
jgi:hypothetical protein